MWKSKSTLLRKFDSVVELVKSILKNGFPKKLNVLYRIHGCHADVACLHLRTQDKLFNITQWQRNSI